MPDGILALIAWIESYNANNGTDLALFMTSVDGTIVDMEAGPACWDRGAPTEWTYSVHPRP